MWWYLLFILGVIRLFIKSRDLFPLMGLMHNYVIECMRVRLGGIAKQVPPFFRECVFHFYILATNIPL